jgi:hypothetical protein
MPNYSETRNTAAGSVTVGITTSNDYSSCNIKKIGKLTVGFDNSGYGEEVETIFFPSNFEITFRDPNRVMRDALKANSELITVSGPVPYVGKNDPMLTYWDDKLKETTIVATDQSNILKTIALKDQGNNGLNPLGYSDAQYYNVQQMLFDIFAKVNAGANVNVSQDWIFKRWPSAGGNTHAFSEIYVPTNTFFFGSMPYTLLSDLLKGFALNFGCIVGMLDYQNAYFVKRWKSSASSISLLGKIKEVNGSDLLNKLDGIRVVQHAPTVSPAQYDQGTVLTQTSGEFTYPDKVLAVDLWAGCSDAATNINIWDGAALQPIGTVKDTAIDTTFREVRQTIAKYHYGYRSVHRQKNEIDLYGVKDVNGNVYSILNQYSNGSQILRPYQIVLDAEANATKMYAIDIT